MANNIGKTITDIIIAATPIVLAYIAYQQIRMNKKQDLIQKQTDGKMNQLLEATGAQKKAEGKLEGLAATNPELKDLAKDTAAAKIETNTGEASADTLIRGEPADKK